MQRGGRGGRARGSGRFVPTAGEGGNQGASAFSRAAGSVYAHHANLQSLRGGRGRGSFAGAGDAAGAGSNGGFASRGGFRGGPGRGGFEPRGRGAGGFTPRGSFRGGRGAFGAAPLRRPDVDDEDYDPSHYAHLAQMQDDEEGHYAGGSDSDAGDDVNGGTAGPSTVFAALELPPEQQTLPSVGPTVRGTTVERQGLSSLRFAVVASILSNKPVVFTHLRGPLRPHEVNFLRLVSRITVKSTFELSADRTRLLFVPGLIAAGATVVHDLPTPESVATAAAEAKQEPILRTAGYFIEPLLLLLPFARTKCSVTLVGPTQGPLDLSVHTLRTVSIPIAKAFGVEAQLRVVRHSSGDGGCVILTVEPVRRLRSVKLVDFGLVSRVRGIAFGSDVAADLPQRCATSAKGVLLNFLPDIAVPTDVTSNARSGHAKGSGFGIMLVAYTTANGTVVSQEATASVREAPEDVGQRAAKLLLEEISRAGCIDRHHQALTLFLMALGPDEVSSVRFGGFSPMASTVVDLLDQFFAVHPVMKDEASPMPGGPMTTLVRCLGSGTINLTKRSS